MHPVIRVPHHPPPSRTRQGYTDRQLSGDYLVIRCCSKLEPLKHAGRQKVQTLAPLSRHTRLRVSHKETQSAP